MKRDDLQGIRGIAILLVLLFHLQPSAFPLGFVGVDMFFVLSGYLIALVLSKEPFSLSQIRDFYSRRFRRIVPLLYITVLFVYFACMFLLTDLDKRTFKTDLSWSLSFLSNFQPIFEIQGYWDQITSYRFLAHCWSLGVEIQFYMIAPLIISLASVLSPMIRKSVFILIITSSSLFQLWASPKIAHGFLLSRIWQFLLGSLCFESSKGGKTEIDMEAQAETDSLIEKEEAGDKKITQRFSAELGIGNFIECLLALLCASVLLNWNVGLTMSGIRIFATVSVAILIQWPQITTKSFLTNKTLVYIGDISYVLYLLHWPIIVAAKYIALGPLEIQDILRLSLAIFLVSALFHSYIEKPVIRLQMSYGFGICTLCILTFCLTPFEQCCMPPNTELSTKAAGAIQWNTLESMRTEQQMQCSKDVTTPAWTGYDELPEYRCETKGHGNLSILVIGNSIAYRAFPLIHKVLDGRYKELRLYSKSGCSPLTFICPSFTEATHKVVDKVRPDILWFAHGRVLAANSPFSPNNTKSDVMYNTFKEHMDFYSKRVGIFVIDLPYYTTPVPVANEIVKRLRFQQPIDDLKVSKYEAVKLQEEHRKRLRAVKCSNCFYQNVEEGMFDGDTLYFYNRTNYHSYYEDDHHMTPEMLEKLRLHYEQTADTALNMVEENRSVTDL